MCSQLTMKRPERTQRCLFLSFIVNITYSGVFIVNSEHISHLERREKCRNTCFILEKRKKSKFNRLQIEVFFLPIITPLPYISPPNIGPSNLSFARIYAQGVLTGFYGIRVKTDSNMLASFGKKECINFLLKETVSTRRTLGLVTSKSFTI